MCPTNVDALSAVPHFDKIDDSYTSITLVKFIFVVFDVLLFFRWEISLNVISLGCWVRCPSPAFADPPIPHLVTRPLVTKVLQLKHQDETKKCSERIDPLYNSLSTGDFFMK